MKKKIILILFVLLITIIIGGCGKNINHLPGNLWNIIPSLIDYDFPNIGTVGGETLNIGALFAFNLLREEFEEDMAKVLRQNILNEKDIMSVSVVGRGKSFQAIISNEEIIGYSYTNNLIPIREYTKGEIRTFKKFVKFYKEGRIERLYENNFLINNKLIEVEAKRLKVSKDKVRKNLSYIILTITPLHGNERKYCITNGAIYYIVSPN